MAAARSRRLETAIGVGIVVVLAVVYFLSGGSGSARPPSHGGTSLSSTTVSSGRSGVVPFDRLPPQARHTVRLIERGGPFPFSHDGAVFANREGQLPAEPSGYYHEYTVATPGSPDRGARRIVAGQDGELYYTADHYRTFQRIKDLQHQGDRMNGADR
jgi:ribonuclease T1